MKGQPPKSAARKALQGNTGKRKKTVTASDAGDEEVQTEAPPPEENRATIFFSDDAWAPPAWLPPGARAVWIEQLPTVLKQSKLQQAHLPTFAQYCLAQHRVQQYTQELAGGETYTTPSGFIRSKPQVELREKALKAMLAHAESLNLTPKSWIGSMGTFAGRQLDMFMDGGRHAPEVKPEPQRPGVAPVAGPMEQTSVGGFLANRPTLN